MVSNASSKAYPTLFFSKMLLILCVSFITFASFLAVVFLYPLFADGKATEIEIQKNEVNEYLKYPGHIAWPNWDIEKIAYRDDQFTSPIITVHFQNGIVLELSKAKFDISHMQARTLDINGDGFTYYSDRQQKYFLWAKGSVYYLIIAPEKMDDDLYYRYIKELTD